MGGGRLLGFKGYRVWGTVAICCCLMHECIYTYVHRDYVYIRIYTCTYIYKYIYICVDMYVCICIYRYIRAYRCIRICMRICIQQMYVCIYVYRDKEGGREGRSDGAGREIDRDGWRVG